MTQKHHQEEISGPLDLTEAAPLASECPRPKRARIHSPKAHKNWTQSEALEVLSFRPTITSLNVPKPTPLEHLDSSSLTDIHPSISERQRPSNSQNSSQQTLTNTQDRKEKEEWLIQFDSIQNKSEILKILTEHIGPNRSYSEKLNILKLYSLEQVLLYSYELKLINLFYWFISKELFKEIINNINEYVFRKKSTDFNHI